MNQHAPKRAEVSDGFGSTWLLCGDDCGLEVVRPGKVQCDRSGCKVEADDELSAWTGATP